MDNNNRSLEDPAKGSPTATSNKPPGNTKKSGLGKGALYVAVVLIIVAKQYFDHRKNNLPLRDQVLNNPPTIRNQPANYTIDVGPDSNVLKIHGIMEEGFAYDFAQALNRHPNIRAIEVTSDGGLIGEAFWAAKIIADTPSITVTARTICNSACLLFLSGGGTRLADWDMGFSLHDIIKQDALSTYDQEVDKFMIARGIPKSYTPFELIGQPPLEVSAMRLTEEGFVHGIIDGNHAVSVADARRRVISEPMNASDLKTLGGFAFVQRAIYEMSGKIVDPIPHSQAIGVFLAAVKSADDTSLSKYALHTNRLVEHLFSNNKWEACAAFDYFPSSATLPRELTSELENIVKEVIVSAMARNWHPYPVPPRAQEIGDLLFENVLSEMEMTGGEQIIDELINADFDPGLLYDPQIGCTYMLAFTGQLASLNKSDAAMMWRLIFSDFVEADFR